MGMGHDLINATARGSHTRQRDDAEHRAVQAAMNTDGRDATIHSRVLQGDGRRPVCASPIVCRSNGKHQICGWLGWSRLWRRAGRGTPLVGLPLLSASCSNYDDSTICPSFVQTTLRSRRNVHRKKVLMTSEQG